MFYFSRKKENKLGVVDTSDGIEEFYTSENIKAILKSSNITIIKHSDMKKLGSVTSQCYFFFKMKL